MAFTHLLKRTHLLKKFTSARSSTSNSTVTTTDTHTISDSETDNSVPLLSLAQVSYTLTNDQSINKISASSQGLKNHDGNASQQTLVNNIDLSIMPYDKISIVGPNGAGKSTLVKLMLGLLVPTGGSIVRHSDLRMSYVPQKFAVPNILPLRVCDLLAQVTTHQASDHMPLNNRQRQILYEQLSIAPLLSRQVNQLSGGETQRVLLTRALLNRPNLLILDEPMQGLDPESESWLYQFIDDLPDFLQCAMVVVSHDLHWVMQGSRHVVCLNKHICCEGQPSELSISTEFKRLFGHEFEQPYIHKPHGCQHKIADEV